MGSQQSAWLFALMACGPRPMAPGPGPGSDSVTLQLVTSGLTHPLHVTAPPGDTARLFVVQQDGQVRVLVHDTLLATPFLDVSGHITSGGERGLLSLAFHPSYAQNGWFYVYFTDPNGDTRVVRYRVSPGPNVADSLSGDTVLSVAQPFANHNGGLLLFGLDGMLYVGLGDGGSSGDPLGNGQSLGTLLGKLLRIDVDAGGPYAIPAGNPFVGVSGARGEIWLYGLRNPWRFSFDRANGDLYVADVGQSGWEEVNVLPAGGGGGVNYGWNTMEGNHCYAAATCTRSGLTLPVVEYETSEGCAVTGGYVYRGDRVPALVGVYLYGDFCGGWVRSLRYVGGQAIEPYDWPSLRVSGGLSSFGEDARGELYITTLSGSLYRIVGR